MFIRAVFLRNNSIFLKKCKNELKNRVLPKKVPLFYPFLGKMRLTHFFWPILAEFFIPPGNMFIRTVFLRNNSIFLKKCKNGLKNGVLPKKYPFFANFYPFLGKMRLTHFFWPISAEFFIPPGNMFIRTIFLRNNSIFLKKCENGLKNWVLPKTKSTFFAYFYSFFCFPNRDFTRKFLRRYFLKKKKRFGKNCQMMVLTQIFKKLKFSKTKTSGSQKNDKFLYMNHSR